MNLLIHDLPAEDWEIIADSWQGWDIISDSGGIRPCIGCFRCWTGGTGTCVFKDGYEKMGERIHNADEVVVMSRYTYGGFSSFVKNVFDRSLGYVLPEFETAYGEMHHKKRYPEDKPVTFRFRGAGLSENDKEKAQRYVAAVCRNLRGTVKEVIFDECAPAADDTAAAMRESPERSGVLLVDCSLRGKRSNTRIFLKRLQAVLRTHAEMEGLSSVSSSVSSPEEVAYAVSRAETVILGIPLYVDGIPSSALRMLNAVKRRENGNPGRVYTVVNNGLYESRQNENLLSMIRDWCSEKGFQYCGALAIGAGEMVGTLMRGRKRVLWPAHNAISGLRRLAETIAAGCQTEDIYADPFLFARWLYILIANTNWQRLKRKETGDGSLSP